MSVTDRRKEAVIRVDPDRLWPPHRFPGARRRTARAVAYVRSELARRVWSAYSHRRYGETRTVDVAFGGSLVVRTDDFRAFRIAQAHGTQPEKIGVWRALADLDPDIVVDVGANYGEFTMALAPRTLPILSIEPNPEVVACLQQTFARFANVTIIEAAAKDDEGPVVLFRNLASSGSGSLTAGSPERERRDYRRGGRVEPVEVTGVSLAHLLSDRTKSVRSALIKIDDEGHELAVLRGFEPTRGRLDWWRALVEYTPSALVEAGIDPLHAWKELSRFRGVVVSAADRRIPVPADAARRATTLGPEDVLADTPPGEVDVVIGEGLPSVR